MFQEPSCSSCSLACGAARPQLGTGTGSSSNCSQRGLQGEGKAWGLGGWVPYGCFWARPHCQGREHPWERKLATDNIWGSACGTSCGTSLWHVPWHTAPAQHEQSLPSSWGVGQGCCGSTEVLGKKSCPRRLRRDACGISGTCATTEGGRIVLLGLPRSQLLQKGTLCRPRGAPHLPEATICHTQTLFRLLTNE